MDNAVGTFLPADPSNLSLTQKAYELRHLYLGFQEVSPAKPKGVENQPSTSVGNNSMRSEISSTLNSRRRIEAVATFRLIWWNQGSASRKKLSIWRPVVPEGMVYFGDIAVQGYEMDFCTEWFTYLATYITLYRTKLICSFNWFSGMNLQTLALFFKIQKTVSCIKHLLIFNLLVI